MTRNERLAAEERFSAIGICLLMVFSAAACMFFLFCAGFLIWRGEPVGIALGVFLGLVALAFGPWCVVGAIWSGRDALHGGNA